MIINSSGELTPRLRWTLTESRKSAVGEYGFHYILEVCTLDGKPALAVEITPEEVASALGKAYLVADEAMKELECDGVRVELNHGRLLTRPNFHVHIIGVKPGVEFRRSIDYGVVEPAPSA